jgi:prepilin signal peptidase PulO-like enzyme (type II secretory pathway)
MSSGLVSVRRAPLRPNAATPAVAAAVAASGAVLLRLELSPWSVVVAAATAALVWVAAIDLESRLLPDRIVLTATGCVLLASAIFQPTHTIEHVVWALLAGGFLFVAAALRPGDLGLGDAKLMLLVGAVLGSSVLSALLVGFGVFALLGVALVARDGRRALKRQLPLGPFIAAGAIAVLVLGG